MNTQTKKTYYRTQCQTFDVILAETNLAENLIGIVIENLYTNREILHNSLLYSASNYNQGFYEVAPPDDLDRLRKRRYCNNLINLFEENEYDYGDYLRKVRQEPYKSRARFGTLIGLIRRDKVENMITEMKTLSKELKEIYHELRFHVSRELGFDDDDIVDPRLIGNNHIHWDWKNISSLEAHSNVEADVVGDGFKAVFEVYTTNLSIMRKRLVYYRDLYDTLLVEAYDICQVRHAQDYRNITERENKIERKMKKDKKAFWNERRRAYREKREPIYSKGNVYVKNMTDIIECMRRHSIIDMKEHANFPKIVNIA